MAKLPYMQFYPSDYQADVRRLSMSSQGAWMQILCVLWRAPKPGRLTLTVEEWARELGCPASDITLYITDLEHHQVGKILREVIENVEHITIISKRIVREKSKQSLALKRKQKQRHTQMSRDCHATVTPQSQQSHAEESESESESEIRIIKDKEKKERRVKKDCDPPTVVAETPAQQVWNRYETAYLARYKTEPMRNAMVNGQIASLIKRIGVEAAPEVAAFYVRHNDQFYIRKGHPIGLLLQNCEGLHTQWKTGKTVTHAQARKIDETQGRVNVFQEIINERKGEAVNVKAT